MYDTRITTVVLFSTISLLANGCSHRPHNNVLLFGTDTKVALDVSTEATQGGMPEITFGYKRREAVWLPLSRNNSTCKRKPDNSLDCEIHSTTDKYVGTAKGIDSSKGGKIEESDTYSVFASFGAEFDSSASAESQGANASGGLAQFFATGVAAQRLGANKDVAKALSIEPVDTAAKDEAIKRAEAEKDRADTNEKLVALLSDKERSEAGAEGVRINNLRNAKKEIIFSRLEKAKNFNSELIKIFDKAVANHGLKSTSSIEKLKKATDRKSLEKYLRFYRNPSTVLDPLFNATVSK